MPWALNSTAALIAEPSSSPGMKRLTARRANGHCGTCVESQRFCAHQRSRLLNIAPATLEPEGFARAKLAPRGTKAGFTPAVPDTLAGLYALLGVATKASPIHIPEWEQPGAQRLAM